MLSTGPALGVAAAWRSRPAGDGRSLSGRPAADLLSHIGRTPLLSLASAAADLGETRLLGKAEWLNRAARSRTGPRMALRLARRLGGRPAVIVTVLCDSGARYLGERFWEEE